MRRWALVLATLRDLRLATVLWVVGGALFMYLIAESLSSEMSSYPGGPQALAESVRPGVESLRLLRWPADRLDTLGGYLTYHNVFLYTLFLSLWAAVQGARAVRGAEESHALEQVLATGWSRRAVVRDRALGFLAALVVVTAGLAAGTALAMYAAGAADATGSLVTVTGSGLAALAAYGLGMLVAQLLGSARSAAGASALLLTGLYVVTNVWDEVGPLGLLRFVSPYWYATSLRGLVPGVRVDPWAAVALVVMTAVMLALASMAFERRDYGAALWHPVPVRRPGTTRVQRPALRTLWTATLLHSRAALAVWTAATVLWVSVMVALEPTVMQAWEAFGDYLGGDAAGSGASPSHQYLAFAGDMISPVVAAYVVAQAAGWVADLEQGRVEVVLAAPVSWTRLVRERVAAALAGTAVITAGGVAAVAVGSARIDVPVDAAGLARMAGGCLLLGGAVAGVSAVVVAVSRTGPAIPVIAVFLAASYLVGLMTPMLGWPDWVGRLSVFTALGHPYLEWTSTVGTLVLLVLFVPGVLLAGVLSERTPKVL